jgi:glycosyltransferase involved in cell wall biosynthesis
MSLGDEDSTSRRLPLRVSVVVIFLNEERFLAEAVESVMAQRCQDWELLLVDDGSTDGSTAIAKRYAEACPGKVRYLQHMGHQNRGMSASRNLGIQHASGTYIAILDADDVLLPSALEEQTAVLDSHPDAALVYGRVQRWYSWTGQAEDLQRDSIRDLAVPAESLVHPPTQLILLLKDRGMPSGVLARRKMIQRVGGFEESFRGLYEDNAFLTKVCLTESVFASNQCWYRYRKHSSGSCAVAVDKGQYQAARLGYLVWVEQYLIDHGVKDPRIWRALREELRPFRHPLWHRVLLMSRRLLQGRFRVADGAGHSPSNQAASDTGNASSRRVSTAR